MFYFDLNQFKYYNLYFQLTDNILNLMIISLNTTVQYVFKFYDFRVFCDFCDFTFTKTLK